MEALVESGNLTFSESEQFLSDLTFANKNRYKVCGNAYQYGLSNVPINPYNDALTMIDKQYTSGDRPLSAEQVGGVRFMWRNAVDLQKGCIIGHSMGIGKTLQGTAFAHTYSTKFPEKKIVILAPKTIAPEWFNKLNTRGGDWPKEGDPPSVYQFSGDLSERNDIYMKVIFTFKTVPAFGKVISTINGLFKTHMGTLITDTTDPIQKQKFEKLKRAKGDYVQGVGNISDQKQTVKFNELMITKDTMDTILDKIKTDTSIESAMAFNGDLITKWKANERAIVVTEPNYFMEKLYPRLRIDDIEVNVVIVDEIHNSCSTVPEGDQTIIAKISSMRFFFDRSCDEAVAKEKNKGKYQFFQLGQNVSIIGLSATPFTGTHLQAYHIINCVRNGHLGTPEQYKRLIIDPIDHGRQVTPSVSELKKKEIANALKPNVVAGTESIAQERINKMKERVYILNREIDMVVQYISEDALIRKLPTLTDFTVYLKQTQTEYELAKSCNGYLRTQVADLFTLKARMRQIYTCVGQLKIEPDNYVSPSAKDVWMLPKKGMTQETQNKEGRSEKKTHWFSEADWGNEGGQGTDYPLPVANKPPADSTPSFEDKQKYEMAVGAIFKLSTKFMFIAEVIKRANEMNEKIVIFMQNVSKGGPDRLDPVTMMIEYLFKIILKDVMISSDGTERWLTFDGSAGGDVRTEKTTIFNDRKSRTLVIIVSKVGTEGVNFPTATRLIIFSPAEKTSVDKQASRRIFRQGQIHPSFVYRLVMGGTYEEGVITLNSAKQDLEKSMLTQQGSLHLSDKGDIAKYEELVDPSTVDVLPTTWNGSNGDTVLEHIYAQKSGLLYKVPTERDVDVPEIMYKVEPDQKDEEFRLRALKNYADDRAAMIRNEMTKAFMKTLHH